MKRIIYVSLLILLAGTFSGCGADTDVATGKSAEVKVNSDTSAKNKTSDFKVIFKEFGSLNCIPCRMMQPVMQEVEKKYHGQVNVVFVDVMTETGRAEGLRNGIRAIPTQVFLDDKGREFFRHTGFFPFEEIEKVLRQKGVN